MNKTLALLVAGASLSAMAQNQQVSDKWQVKYATWSEANETDFENFISKIGEAVGSRKCYTAVGCILNPQINPLAAKHSPEFVNKMRNTFAEDRVGKKSNASVVDCADLPVFLRTYFAYMNHLPFAIPADYYSNDPVKPRKKGLFGLFKSKKGPDRRYSQTGNSLSSMKQFRTGDDATLALLNTTWAISTGSFRLDPQYNSGSSELFDFTYSPALQKGNIKPGTVVYDPAGHIAMVYRVEEDGRIKLIDAHPDNSISSITYGEKFMRSSPQVGAGFKNWRPIQLANISSDANGNLKGTIKAKSNSEIRSYGIEQYYGNQPDYQNWKAGRFIIDNQSVSYYDYVKKALRNADAHYDPFKEFNDSLSDICNDVITRVDAVQVAIDSNIHLKAQPETLPENIYGTDGEWETYSTPSSDTRIRTALEALRKNVPELVNEAVSLNHEIEGEFRAKLKSAYQKIAKNECKISYVNSNGNSVGLTLHEVINRITAISFDPYHCVEKRWGAKGDEMSSCRDGSVKNEWYEAEFIYRARTTRDYDALMDSNLKELKKLNQSAKVVPLTIEDVL